MRCRQHGKPVIVASHLLQSMIEYPTPTRAEVADISDVVRQRADALMLSGESAAGAYPDKAVAVLRAVSGRIEEWCRCDPHERQVRPSAPLHSHCLLPNTCPMKDTKHQALLKRSHSNDM